MIINFMIYELYQIVLYFMINNAIDYLFQMCNLYFLIDHIPLSTFPDTCWDLRVLSTLSYWFSMTNKIKGLRPPPKISSCFGPIIIVIPTIFVQYKMVSQLYIMPASCLNQHNQHPNICWEIFDWSTATKLKPKFETA